MPFKNQDLGWIRVNFKKEEDKALRDFASKIDNPGLMIIRTPMNPIKIAIHVL